MLQKSSILGDIEKNYEIIRSSYEKSNKNKCDFFITSELFLTGYPPQDLLMRNDFLSTVNLFKKKILQLTKKKFSIIVLNIPEFKDGKVFSTLFLFKNGSVVYQKNKINLPNYGVFDEKRYFEEGKLTNPYFRYKNQIIKFLICEEMWIKKAVTKSENADYLISINASPFEIDKHKLRKFYARKNINNQTKNLIYLNAVGCQDELIFDGGSFIMNKRGRVCFQKSFFEETEFIFDSNKQSNVYDKINKINKSEHIYSALIYSLKFYMKNNNFKRVVLGLSGGIDSALCLAIIVDAIGEKNVDCFYLPTIYNSNQSKKDSVDLTNNLNIKLNEISIENLRKDVLHELTPFFKKKTSDITEENIQSRLRGLILMAVSNKLNSLLITTGNKSELAVGYSTLYGDMCGGFSLIKDIYKTQVNSLAKWRNLNIPTSSNFNKRNIIPKSIILKEPTAELKMNQKDIDSLPNYKILDKILELIIDKNNDLQSIKKYGFNEGLIKKVWKMVKNSEFKRYQSAIGPKVSQMSFDKDRRFPITNKFMI